MLQTCLIRGVADGIPNGSHAFQQGLRFLSLAVQEDVPGSSEEQLTSGSQLEKGEVRSEISEGTASRV